MTATEQRRRERSVRVSNARKARKERAERRYYSSLAKRLSKISVEIEGDTLSLIKEQGGASSRAIVGMIKKGTNREAYKIALEHIQSGESVTLELLNSILSKTTGALTEEEYNNLLALKFVNVPLPLKDNKEATAIIGRDVAKTHKDYRANRFVGVYMFTDGILIYIGSSIYLGRRLRAYFKQYSIAKEQRPVMKRLHGPNAHNFTLTVCIIPNELAKSERDYERLARGLEQYYLLTNVCELNPLKVAGAGPAGKELTGETKLKLRARMGTRLYILNEEETILYYVADSMKQYSQESGVGYSMVQTYVNTGKAMYGKFILTQTPPVNRTAQELTRAELLKFTTEVRATRERPKNPNKAGTVVKCIDTINNTEHTRVSIQRAVKYTKGVGDGSRGVSRETIAKLTLSNRIFKGWRFERSTN